MTMPYSKEKEVGGWSVYRGDLEDGLMLFAKGDAIWLPKTTALRLAHSVLEAMMEYWSIDYCPKEVHFGLSGPIEDKEQYVISDSDDGTIFSKGTLQELKDIWWQKLKANREIGGFCLEPLASYEEQFPPKRWSFTEDQFQQLKKEALNVARDNLKEDPSEFYARILVDVLDATVVEDIADIYEEDFVEWFLEEKITDEEEKEPPEL